MKTRNLLVSLVFSVLLVALAAASVSALGTIQVTVNEVENFQGTAGVFAGETIPVRVVLHADHTTDNVRITARLLGQSGVSATTERFDVVAGSTYSRLLNIRMPFDIDPNESFQLEVTVESQDEVVRKIVDFEVQRESYLVEVLSVGTPDQVRAGQTLPLDVVLKNRGRHFAEDTFVKARIAELGVSTTGYFGDLAPVDNSADNEDDAVERRLYLSIPNSAHDGVYTVELEAFNGDSSTIATKKIVVVGAGQESRIISSGATKTFAAGETKTYSITLVNAGNEIKVYDLVLEAPKELTVDIDDSTVVIPAGTSKTVNMQVSSKEEGTYTFSVTVQSDESLVKKETFTASVKGTSAKVNPSVVLTVVLAVIFVVLVIVLVVLLTRRPEKPEYGESYY
jgi:hypothetical protein